VIDFHPDLSAGFYKEECYCQTGNETYDEYYYSGGEESGFTLINRVYIGKFKYSHIIKKNTFFLGFGVIHMLSATLYWWAWKGYFLCRFSFNDFSFSC
jgi:hypothetical protein